MPDSPPPAPRQFDVPRTILHGGGSRRQLPRLARDLGIRRPLLVTDPGVVGLGFAEEARALLAEEGSEAAVFDGVQPDPTDKNVADGLAALEARGADGLVALGGGSPIDTAKAISAQTANPGPLRNYMGLHKIPNPGLPLIAVPTTAGTGSEATKVAVITDTRNHVKMMMLSAPLLPAAAIVDFEYSLGMPQGLTAAVGVDTLTHGIEAYVSRKANAMTDPIALSCVGLVGRRLREAWRNPGDREAREGMMLAACQGGMAFSNSSVCLVHGMSRPVGAVFHLPHGLSNAVLLPAVTRFSVAAAPKRYSDVARAIGPDCADAQDPDETACAKLVDWLEQLNAQLEVPRLSECPGVEASVFEANARKMAADALASGSPANNPRVPTEDEIVELYRQAW